MTDAPDLVFEAPRDRLAQLLSWTEYQQMVDLLGTAIRSEYLPTLIVGVFQGGWMVAQSLADQFTEARVCGVGSAQTPERLAATLLATQDGLLVPIVPTPEDRVLLVDEVVDSGRTAGHFLGALRETGAGDLQLAALVATEGCEPRPRFAARREREMPNYILPWRLIRDFPQTATAVLGEGPHSTDTFCTRLRELGHELSPDRASALLQRLRDDGLVRRTGHYWTLGPAG